MDSAQAAAAMEKQQEHVRQLRAEYSKLEKANDLAGARKVQKQLKEAEKELRYFKKSAFDVNNVLKNLSGSTLEQLQKAQSRLNLEIRKTTRNTDEWADKNKKLKLIKQEIANVNKEMAIADKQSRNFFSRATDGFNKYFGVITTGLATVTGVVMSFRSTVKAFGEYEAQLRNLEALTGLSRKETALLGEEAKKLSTTVTEEGVRITASTVEIMEGFKLVGGAKPELLENRDALVAVTKEALILAEASGLSLNDSVKALTDTMNQFGAPADQARRYIDALANGAKFGAAEIPDIGEAIVKFGVGARNANVSIEESVGLIELLGEKGLKGAEAGTKLNAILNRIAGAKGLDKKALEVLDQYGISIEVLTDKSRPFEERLLEIGKIAKDDAALIKVFGLENKNAAQALLTNIPRYKELAEQMLTVGSAAEQAAINTDHHDAKLKQARNEAENNAIALGKRLAPVMTFSMNQFNKFVQILNRFIDWLERNEEAVVFVTKAILGLAAGYAAFRLQLILTNVIKKESALLTRAIAAAQTIYTAATKSATASTLTFSAAMKTTPWGLIIGLAATAVTLYMEFASKSNEAADAQQKMREEQAQFLKQQSEELTQARILFDQLKRTNSGSKERAALINQINSTYGTTLKNLKNESEFLKQIDQAYNGILNAIRQKIIMQQKEAELSPLVEREVQAQINVNALKKTIEQNELVLKNVGDQLSAEELAATQKIIRDSRSDLKIWESELNKVKQQQESIVGTIPSDIISNDIDNTPGPSPKDNDAEKKLDDLKKKIEQTNFDLAQLARIELDRNIAEIERKWAADIELAQKFINTGGSNREAWKQALQQAMSARDQEIEQVYNIYHKNLSDTLTKDIDETDKWLKQREESRKSVLEQYGLLSIDEQMQAEIEKLTGFYQQDLLNYEEYERAKALIHEKYAKQKAEEEKRIEDKKIREIREKRERDFDKQRQMTSSFSDFFASLKEYEMLQVENQEERGVINKEQAEKKKKEISKKYAIPEFLVKISGIIANTAAGIMQAWATMPPPAAAVMTAIIAATGAVQTGIAISEMNKVKGYKKGLYPVTDQYGNSHDAAFGNKARTGMVSGPTLFLAGEEMPEMIIDGKTMENIQMNVPELIPAIMAQRAPAYAEGYYPKTSVPAGSTSTEDAERLATYQKALDDNTAVMTALMKRLEEPFQSTVVYRDIQKVEDDVEYIKKDLK